MPTITDKLRLEEKTSRNITLWPEGAFMKAYERSAYLFVTQVRPYEVRRRYVHAVKCDVVSTAFPRSVLNKLSLTSEPGYDGCVRMLTDAALDEQCFLNWRDALPVGDAAPVVVAKTVGKVSVTDRCRDDGMVEVCRRIKDANLAAMTPMACMLFLSDLQKMIRYAEV